MEDIYDNDKLSTPIWKRWNWRVGDSVRVKIGVYEGFCGEVVEVFEPGRVSSTEAIIVQFYATNPVKRVGYQSHHLETARAWGKL